MHQSYETINLNFIVNVTVLAALILLSYAIFTLRISVDDFINTLKNEPVYEAELVEPGAIELTQPYN